jgi:tRNA threonylcarbamoyladenosine biosynthesis protein TsaB
MSDHLTYLGIDCSGINASLTLLMSDGRECIVQSDTPRQADVIFPLLEKLFADAAITTKDLTAIGAVTGPGSFTGIRVGLSLAQGLANGLNIPTYGINAFDALKWEVPECNGDILVLESKRPELYVHYNNKIEMLSAPEILNKLNGTQKIIHNLGTNSSLPPLPTPILSTAAAHHAKQYFESKVKTEILSPYYLREADAKPNAA